jgi:hypothetical protein
MRYAYSPLTGEFAVYATAEEFQLASRPKVDDEPQEYRVILKNLKSKDGNNDPEEITTFIDEFVDFIKTIFGELHPDEKIKDVIVMSTMARVGFMWTSLLGDNTYESSYNFFDMLLSYGLNVMMEAGQSKNSEKSKDITEMMSERDFSKLTLAKILLSTLELPQIWKVKKKPDKYKEKMAALADKLKVKITKFEAKYKFSSEDMLKYYGDDTYPEKDMQTWLDATKEVKLIESSLQKYDLVEELVDSWNQAFKED